MTVRARLRDWQLRLGLSRESNPHVGRGPSHEDIARERSVLASRSDSVPSSSGPGQVGHDEHELSVSNPRKNGQAS